MNQSRKRAGAAFLAAGVSLAMVGVALALPAQAATTGCSVSYAVSSQWQGGFGANVTVTNLGDPINGWTLTWSYTAGQQVTQAWNATVTQSGASAMAVNAAWNGQLPAGGSIGFGFLTDSASTGATGFALNGAACTAA